MAATLSSKLTIYHTKMIDEGYPGKTNNEILYTTLDTNMSSDTAVAVTNWARNLVTSLSNDLYEHTAITTTGSLNEMVAEE